MDERPKWTPQQLEALETLRFRDVTDHDPAVAPVADALKNDPELARRLDRILEWDSRVSKAMRDVPVPPGLAEQILQGLEASPVAPFPISKPRKRRRVWLAVTAAVGLAASLIVAALLGNSPRIDEGRLCSTALERFDGNQDPVGAVLAEGEIVDGFRYSPDLVSRPGTLWRHVPDFGRAEAVAYDIPLEPGRKATLYVVRCRSSDLPPRPPTIPQLPTRNLAIAAWQGEGVVYVLAVEERAYSRLVKSRQLI